MSTDSNNHHIAITIAALGSQPVHHIDLAVTAVAVQDVRESMIGSSEFYQSGGEVGKTNIPDGRSYQRIPDVKPAYTQSMSDAGYLPPVGSECLVKSESLDDWYKGECIGFDNNEDGEFAVFAMSSDYPFPVRYAGFQARRIKPLDSRTDEDKAMQDIWDCYRDSQNVKGEYPSITYKILDAIKADKITGVKWMGK